MPTEGLLPGWPGVVVILALIIRDEVRARRLARELHEDRRRLDRSTVLVRHDDAGHLATAAAVGHRRRRGDR